MKRSTAVLLAVVLWGGQSVAGELVWQTFDNVATGIISTVPGWIATPTQPTVSAANAYSAPHALEIATPAGGSSAAYTNFATIYSILLGTEHPVIRVSAKLFVPHTNVNLSFGLKDTLSNREFNFVCTNGVAKLHNSPVSFPLVTGRFVDVTFHLNRSNGATRLYYDVTNIVAWGTYNAGTNYTRFDRFVVTRTKSPSDGDCVFLDNIRVDTFPPYVWAWWRFDEDSPSYQDHVGAFGVTNNRPINLTPTDPAYAYRPLYDGQTEYSNEVVSRRSSSSYLPCEVPTPTMTDWTVEFIFQHDPTETAHELFDWGSDLGFNSTSAYVALTYHTNATGFSAEFRDSQQTAAGYHWLSKTFRYQPDARWHHVAFIKSSTNLHIYFDYRLAHTTNLDSRARGAYRFDTNSRVRLGMALNGANPSDEYTYFDEVRFSTKALDLREFLQPTRPIILSCDNSALNPLWELTLKTIKGREYRTEAASSPTNATWSSLGTFIAGDPVHSIQVPTTPGNRFVRIRPLP